MKLMPGFGKSGISLIDFLISAFLSSGADIERTRKERLERVTERETRGRAVFRKKRCINNARTTPSATLYIGYRKTRLCGCAF